VRKSIWDLRINKHIKILKDNNQNTTIIMDEIYYHNKLMDHLTCKSYRVINKDPMNTLMFVVSTIIKCSSLDDSIKKKLTPNNSTMPCIYGAPKIHKDGVFLILVVNMIGSLNYSL
jgi:hypothetical protein